MNEDQLQYTYKKVGEYREEANKADKKGFWQLLLSEACLILIAADVVCAAVLKVIPENIALGAGVILGLAAKTLSSESNRNNSKSNVADAKADLLEDQAAIAEKGSARIYR